MSVQQDSEKQEPSERMSPSERNRARRERLEAKRPKPMPIQRADGSTVKPGEIPEKATPKARAAWKEVVSSMSSRGSMQSFALKFDLRQTPPETTQSNDLTLDFAYLAPRFVRAKLESGRELLRGPDGDFLLDGDEVIALEGREGKEDIKQLDQMASIATSFIALTDPAGLRLVDLRMLEGPPPSIHARMKAEVDGQTWLQVTSPDFFLFSSAASDVVPIYQVDLGIDKGSKAIRFAVIRETAPADGLPPVTVLVRMSDHLERSGLLVPHLIELYDLDRTAMPPRFHARSTSRLHLKRSTGRLKAKLSPDLFNPPRK